MKNHMNPKSECGDVHEQPNPSRLILARKRRGLTKVDLGRRTGINVKTLGEYEKGRLVPSASAIEQIASVTRFPTPFFYRGDLEEPTKESVSFRSLQSMKSGQRDAALAAGALAFELSAWIDQRFVLHTPDLQDLREFDAKQAATVLRNLWGIGIKPIPNIVQLMESKGVRVFSLSERNRQVDAYSLWYHDLPFVFLNTMKTVEHSRMDAAHELGHLVMHRHGAVSGRDVEKDAKAFASEFLMPEESVRSIVRTRLLAPSMNQMVQLKANWGVSVAALAYRLNHLGLLPDWSYRLVCIELSRFGRQREPAPIAVPETSSVFAQVFSMLKDSGTTQADLASELCWHTSDLEQLIFGLSVTGVTGGGRQSPNTEAQQRRKGFKLV